MLYFLLCPGSKEYKKEVLFPVLSSVARRYGQADLYEGMVSDDEPLVIPRGASEFEVRVRQVIHLSVYPYNCKLALTGDVR